MPVDAVFLDIDGVINDYALIPALWDNIGTVLSREIGGTPADWARANRAVFDKYWEGWRTWGTDPTTWLRNQNCGLLRAMCAHLDMEPPSDDLCDALMREEDVAVARMCTAVVAGARDTILALASQFTVHMATGNPSWRVDALLEGLGVRQSIGLSCGPDLVRSVKHSEDFYPQVFELAGCAPRDAVVVDDVVEQIRLATSSGALTVHVTDACDDHLCNATAHSRLFRDVPGVLTALL